MSDIVQRLRAADSAVWRHDIGCPVLSAAGNPICTCTQRPDPSGSYVVSYSGGNLLKDAADEIERLRLAVAQGDTARRHHVETWKAANPGKSYGDVHAPLWISEPPYTHKMDNYALLNAIAAALLQEGMTAWIGDGTGIVGHMINAQSALREKAESRASVAEGALKQIARGDFYGASNVVDNGWHWFTQQLQQIAAKALQPQQ